MLKPSNKHRAAKSAAGALAALVLALHVPGAAQQPCNPVIDGTFCAEQMPRSRPGAQPPMIRPIGSIGSAISAPRNTPAGTLGGISIRSGGQTCVGLLRRGACS